jgi:hypothetical protein
VELPEAIKQIITRDIKGVHVRTGEKIWFRKVENFMNPEYSVLREFFPDSRAVINNEPFLCGAAQTNGSWILGRLDAQCDFHPL